MDGRDLELWIEVRVGDAVLDARRVSLAVCVEDAHLRGVLAGAIPNDGTLPAFELEPEDDVSPGRGIEGFRLALAGKPGAGCRYAREAFAAQARRALHELRSARRLGEDEAADWRLVARAGAGAADLPAAPASAARAAVRVSRARFPLHPQPLPQQEPDSLAVEVEAAVLATIERAVLEGRAVERAGILIGRLLHDAERRCALLRVDEELPVSEGSKGASGAHFSLSPLSLLAARRAVAGRGDGAAIAGWWHSHVPCAACFDLADCDKDLVFFSEPDEEVQASAFSRAFAIALVAGKVKGSPASRPGFRMYGWESARIAQRDFDVVGPGAEAWQFPEDRRTT